MPQNYQLVKIIFDCLIIHFFKLYSGLSFIHTPQNELCCLKTVKWNYGKLWNLIFWKRIEKKKKKTVSILKDWSGERWSRTYNIWLGIYFQKQLLTIKITVFPQLGPFPKLSPTNLSKNISFINKNYSFDLSGRWFCSQGT